MSNIANILTLGLGNLRNDSYYLFVIVSVSIKFWENRKVAFITAMEIYVWKIIYFYRLRAYKADAYLLILRQLGAHYVVFRPFTFSTVNLFTTATIKICNLYSPDPHICSNWILFTACWLSCTYKTYVSPSPLIPQWIILGVPTYLCVENVCPAYCRFLIY